MRSRSSGPAGRRLSVGQAVALGALHGPAELLPISSSGHVTAVPWLLGWSYGQLDGEIRKSFEVALHAGTLAALLIALRDELRDAGRLDARRIRLIMLSSAPPGLLGYVLERPIERHLGTPPTIAAGLIAGAIAMALADRAPETRSHDEAGACDALWLGVAQAGALWPGVSRHGATLAAARARGFGRADAGRLSREVALPVIAGATGLKTLRLLRGVPPQTSGPLTAGAAAAFLSTLGSTSLIKLCDRDRSLLSVAAYRVALAAAILTKLAHRGRSPHRVPGIDSPNRMLAFP
jgi:undecaprenyl-diphosphatase